MLLFFYFKEVLKMASREVKIDSIGNTIKIECMEVSGMHMIYVDGNMWVAVDNPVHAAVIYNMLCDHITEYMHFEKL